MPSPNHDDLESRLARYASHFALPEREEKPALIGPESVEASEVAGKRGRYWLRSVDYSPRDPWGETIVEPLHDRVCDAGLRIPFSGVDARIDLRKCLFVDCETTGLSGGAGTVAFLIAVGQYQRGLFRVDQYFLPDLGDEAGALDAIVERFADAAALVTYNGSSFDLPLLEGRFTFWRVDNEFRTLPHLDLLWPTRSLFGHRLESCSLSSVEQWLLRIARVEDLPGAEVPDAYFQYLREGFSPRLHAVFEHNRLDVVSLFVYALWLNQHTDPSSPELDSPDDLYALARFWHRHRQSKPALRALDEAGLRVNDRTQKAALHRLRGHILKRERDFDAACIEWRAAARSHPGNYHDAEELAKSLEHRQRDYAEALRVVDGALKSLEFAITIEEMGANQWRDRFFHRRQRLLKRLSSSRRRS